MSFATLVGLLGQGTGGTGDGPSGPPTNVSTTTYGGSLIKVTWKAGDALASSRVYRKVGVFEDLLTQVDAGVLSYETGYSSGTFGVSHYRNGQETSIVYES